MERKDRFYTAICLTTLVAAFIYGIILPFCWGNDPFDSMGTLSILCEHRKGWFWLWCLLDGGAFCLNSEYMYTKYGLDRKWIRALPVIALLFSFGIALTLGHSVADWNPKRIAHWVCTGCYVAALALSIVVYALSMIKKGKVYKWMLISTVAALAVFVGWLLILGKSCMMELIPHIMLQLMFLVFNFILSEKTSNGPDIRQR